MEVLQQTFDDIEIPVKQKNIFFNPAVPTQENNIVTRMVADNDVKKKHYDVIKNQQHKGFGMDSFPIEIYNKLLRHWLETGKTRDAMLLICQGNWGMRFSDVVRVRFCHIFNADGSFKDVFTLPNGEQKTSKKNIYYNNKATKAIIKRYITENPTVSIYDYLFTSNSNNKKYISVADVEASEIYGSEIAEIEDLIAEKSQEIQRTLSLYGKGIATEEEIADRIKAIREEKTELENKYNQFKARPVDESLSKIMILEQMTRQSAGEILKIGLEEIGVICENKRAACNKVVNTAERLNTHSLRKTFGEVFYNTAVSLKEEGKLNVDIAMLNLLQHKFMHSSNAITRRYNKVEENAFKTICTNMNLGLDVLNSTL